ncbi:hypothetical protein [Caldivirga sp.]|uniref:hypothetical protein n=1 Tax=Caldivirga sp. TaxID=2080243 RepID=UPI0025C345E4|nr:hypothetical protein [Caldivirga sp.]
MRNVCPLLKKTEGGYICGAVDRTVNPEAWYCFMDFPSCPLYINYVRRQKGQETQAVAQTQQVTTEVKPIVTVTQQVPVRTAISEPEDEAVNKLRSILDSMQGRVKALDETWKDYEDKANTAKSELDKNEHLIMQYIASLEGIKANLEESIKELEYRRSAGIIDEESYSKARDYVDKRLSNVSQQLSEMKEMFNKIQESILTHYKRVLSESTEAAKVKLSLAKLEELYRTGKVSKEVYEKIKAQLAVIGGQ